MGGTISKSDEEQATTTTLLVDEETILIDNQNEPITTTTTTKIASSSSEEVDQIFRVIISGRSCAGKSCFLFRMVENTYENLLSTTGVDFKVLPLVSDQKKIKLQFWDTAGQERYMSMIKPYFELADYLIIVVDVTMESDRTIYYQNLYETIKNRGSNGENDNPHIIVVATKVDLPKRTMSKEEILKTLKEIFKVDYNFPYFEVSSLTGIGIEDVKQYLSGNALRECKTIKKDVLEIINIKDTKTRIVTRKRKCVTRDESFTKQNVVLLTTKKGLMYGEETSFWQKLFPYTFSIGSGTCFKVDKDKMMIEIEDATSTLYLYFHEENIMNDFLKEWKSVFSSSEFRNTSIPFNDIVKIYKIRCKTVGATPVEYIYKFINDMTLTTQDSSQNLTCNAREMLRDHTAKQKLAFFSTLAWASNIRTMDLGNNKLYDSDIKDLCKSLIGLPYISSLYLSNNSELTKNSCVHIVDMLLKRDSFGTLSMSGCNKISNEGAITLLSCINIEKIDLSRCGLTDIVANKIILISKYSENSSFKDIRIMLNRIDVKKFEEQIGAQSTIKIDILSNNNPTPNEEEPIADVKEVVGQDPNQQSLIKNRYRIENRIGKGGFGVVFKVFDELNKETVALKSIDFDSIYDLEKAFDEIRNHQKLTHKHIVKIIDFTMSATDMKLYIIMPLFEMGDLSHIISQHQKLNEPFSEKLIGNLLIQSAESLNYILENHKLVHCDIKPANLLIRSINNATGEVHIALNDFGLSLHVPSKSRYVSDVGYSPHYSSPETIEGKGANFKGDVFSLGVTVFQMMSCKNVCIWKLYMGVNGDNVKKQLRDMITHNYSDLLINLVLEMVSFSPEDRPDYNTIQKIAKQIIK